jgi:hypothetical protein
MTLPLQAAERAYDLRQCALHYEDAPTAESLQADLEDTKLGTALLALLTLAQAVDHKAAIREGEHVQNMRRHLFRARPEERLAEKLLNLLGSVDDCFVTREIAERLAQ